ncbi:ATP-binding protein, partial [Pseudomonas sp. MD332_6]|uniref:ATP-binding protein n=1 Tax=Pseudomonas sp. MD332_6 TaxID=3241256 RepID=UPI0036D2F56A
VELDPLIVCAVMLDPLRFNQVVYNLLGNAIKFTASGQVRLGAMGATHVDGHMNLWVGVEETGIGISAEDQQRLFTPG